MRSTLIATVVLVAGNAAVAVAGGVPAFDPKLATIDGNPTIQVALLLDTSNSMDGLIDQARSQLWRIVNQFAGARRAGRAARLQVALYEYGNSRLSPATGYVRQVLPFTSDLDRVSEQLFALTTLGGDEFCGTVIQAALDELRWSPSPADLKVVFIAGNEPFSQGPVDFRAVCRRATQRGVVVNTIFCGPPAEGAATGWLEGARLAYGSASSIDQSRVVEHVDAPQDAEIARLGLELNNTYLPYGAAGRSGQSRQEAQDRNAASAGKGSQTNRAVTKANRLYSNASWDLVDAVRNAEVDVTALKTEDLPEPLRKLAAGERKAYVEAMGKERQRVQAQINGLNAARERYVAQQRQQQGQHADTLDTAMAKTLRSQAAQKGLELE